MSNVCWQESSVILRLGIPQPAVLPVPVRQQLLMGSGLHRLSRLHDDYPVAHPWLTNTTVLPAANLPKFWYTSYSA